MIKEEDKELELRFGKKSPFRVPDGYFENFADRLMAKLPEQPGQNVASVPQAAAAVPVGNSQTAAVAVHVSVWRRWRPAVAVAASVCAVMFSVMALVHKPKADGGKLAHTTAVGVSADSYTSLDVAADYTMLDNDDIYAMVSEN